MKKLRKYFFIAFISLFVIFKVFPKIGLYTYIFDTNNYNKAYKNSIEIISDLNELTPKTKEKAELFLELCHAEDLYPKITETYRSQERQKQLYEKGRSVDGPIVTWTKKSRHTDRYAFDICKEGNDPYGDHEFFLRCAQIGKSIGLNPGYYWTPNQDMPHYQYDPWWAK